MRLACVLGVSCVMAAAAPPVPPDAEEAAYPAIERFVKVLETVRSQHPDADLLAYDRLVNRALEGMLAGLDPHSSFMHPEMAGVAEMDAEIASLGITLGMRDDGPYVAAVAPLGAASEKIAVGSSLLEIDGRATTGADFEEILGALQRSPGETSRLLVKTPTEPRPMEVSLTHRWIEERSIGESRMLAGDVKTGYIRLAQFGSGCAREMEAALDELEDQGMERLIFDLRGNGGGHLGETVNLLGLFVPPGTEVVTTQGRGGEKIESMKTPERQRRKREYPVVILIDRLSASASELTAAALKDLGRAKVVGETSYGKGSVQHIIPMGAGTALRLTVATYHSPSGSTPHRIGVTPDIEVQISDEDRMNFDKSRRRDSLGEEDRRIVEAWRDPVLEKALESGFERE